jgi:LmbE family N-acetylglucosaminyl deacetylase
VSTILPDSPARIVVISPHLDDAVLSIGATIRGATARGSEVTVLTVLGCDPGSDAPSGWWDRRAGYRTEGEAARGRREEDRRACDLVGAAPMWLPFGDSTYERHGPDDDIHSAVAERTAGAELVLVPGFPLSHPDHAFVTRLVLERGLSSPMALYVEQPYTTNESPREPWKWLWRPGMAQPIEHTLPGPPRWRTVRTSVRRRREKLQACKAYRTQIPLLRGPKVLWRTALYEALRGGETLGSIPGTN